MRLFCFVYKFNWFIISAFFYDNSVCKLDCLFTFVSNSEVDYMYCIMILIGQYSALAIANKRFVNLQTSERKLLTLFSVVEVLNNE